MHQNLLDQEGPSSPPDVLAHSFGTWLIGNLLLTSTDVRLGRLVLTGSILPPNFPWDRLIQEGKVQAVLCHTAGKDCWARAAHFFIPKSGPSGCIGFSSALVTHIHEMDFRHSSFFQRHRLQECFDKTWAPFLTDPNPCPGDPSIRALRWSPSWARIITFPVVILVALLLLLILLAIAYFAIIGVLSLKGA